MTTLRVPALMKVYLGNLSEVPVQGSTVSEIIADLVKRYPAIQNHIIDKNGELRRHVNLFLNDKNIKDLDGLETSVQENDRIILLPSISGG